MSFSTFIAILRARIWLVLTVLGLVVITTLVISLILPPTYKATTTVVIQGKSKDPISGAILPMGMMDNYIATQADIISSQNVALKVVNDLRLADYSEIRSAFMSEADGKGDIHIWLADKFIGKYLSVEPSRSSSAVDISFESPDPNFAAAVANAVAREYIDTNLELQTEPAHQLSVWYEVQLKKLRTNLQQAQTRLSDYQHSHGLVSTDQNIDVENTKLNQLAGQMVAAQSQAFDAASRQGVGSADVMNTPVVQQLRTDLATKEASLAQMAQSLGKNHPQYQQAQAEVETLRAKLSAEISASSKALTSSAVAARQREQQMRSALANEKAHVLDVNKLRDELSVLMLDVNDAQHVYDNALQQYSQNLLSSQQSTQTDIAILNPAVAPIKPYKPKLFLNLVLATFLGGMLAVGMALVMEMADRRVRNYLDVTELLGVPVLSVLAAPNSLNRRWGWLPRLKFKKKSNSRETWTNSNPILESGSL